MRTINLIVIHCSATPNGQPIGPLDVRGKPTQTPTKVIDGWHAARGFKRQPDAAAEFNSALIAIGYHYVIDLDGNAWSGRSLAEVPAQAAGFNANAVAICMVGTDSYTPLQWKKLLQLVVDVRMDYNVPLRAPLRVPQPATAVQPLGYRMLDGICGHRDLSPDKNGNGLIEPFEYSKTCPGFSVADWIKSGLQALPAHTLSGGKS